MNENTEDKKKIYIILISLYECFNFILCCHLGIYKSYHLSADFSDILTGGIAHMKEHFFVIFPITSDAWRYFAIATFASLIAFALFYYNAQARYTTMKGKECGTAEFMNEKDLKKYNRKYSEPFGSSKAKLSPNNIILAEDIFLSQNGKRTKSNNNILVMGGSGAGKTRYFLKSNLLQFHASYLISDPNSDIQTSTGHALLKHGYTIKTLNLTDMSKSHRYNPFRYLKEGNEEQVLQMVDIFIANTEKSSKGSSGDQFWTNAERMLYMALCFYLIEVARKEDQNWPMVAWMLNLAEVDENDSSKESDLDKLFNARAKEDPQALSVRYYRSFHQAAGKTMKSILISCATRCAVFHIPAVKYLMSDDELELEKLGNEKTAVFMVIDQVSSTFNFISAMAFSSAFSILYDTGKELSSRGGEFRYNVRFLLDELANIGYIPKLPNILATCRKLKVGVSVIIQNISQLEVLFDKEADSVSGNCDSILYLGGSDYPSAEFISKLLGKRTVRTSSTSRSSGNKSGYSENFQYTGRDLMSPDEIIRMDREHCIVIKAAEKPIFASKYDYTKHPNYCETADYNPEFLYEPEVREVHKELKEKDEQDEKERKKNTAAYIESQMREAVKKSLGSETPVIKSFSDFMQSYNSINESGSDIFSQMSSIKTEIAVNEKEKAKISSEVAHIILAGIKENTAKSIIEDFKERYKKAEKSSFPAPLPTITDELKESGSVEVDEFTQTWF